MTKDEVKRENRNTDGDPLIRGRRRSMHAKISQNQMLSAVSEASVVVVNPTHVAVALSYKAGGVPTVVAKGGDGLAARIRERAFQSDVPVVEARPLARILHDSIDVGSEVPAHLYEAVAIVIAFVMRSPKSTVEGMIRRVTVPNSKLVDVGS
jgi:flagellar biosynthetic protein FlhB